MWANMNPVSCHLITYYDTVGSLNMFIQFSFLYRNDIYGNGPNNYLLEPDTSAVGLLWSQVPDSRVHKI